MFVSCRPSNRQENVFERSWDQNDPVSSCCFANCVRLRLIACQNISGFAPGRLYMDPYITHLTKILWFCRFTARFERWYSRILISSRLWSMRGQMHHWRHHYKVFSSAVLKWRKDLKISIIFYVTGQKIRYKKVLPRHWTGSRSQKTPRVPLFWSYHILTSSVIYY